MGPLEATTQRDDGYNAGSTIYHPDEQCGVRLRREGPESSTTKLPAKTKRGMIVMKMCPVDRAVREVGRRGGGGRL
jgi:hypothetical protein